MTDTAPADMETQIARNLNMFVASLENIISHHPELTAVAIEAYGRIISAQIAASSNIAQQLQDMTRGMLGDEDPATEPDDANVLLYEGNPLKVGHTMSLKAGGKLVVIQDKADPGEVEVKFARRVNGVSAIHTVRMNDDGITQ